MKNLIAVAALAAIVSAPAFAQDPPKEWTGEGAFNAGVTQGNTHTTDIGAGLKLKHTLGQWAESGELSGDYGKIDGVETKNRIYAAGQVDYLFNDKWSFYGRGTIEH